MHTLFTCRSTDKLIVKKSDTRTLETNASAFPKSSELILQLSHKDVFLDFFKDKKKLILQLKSGTHLTVRGNRLYARINDKLLPVLQFSAKSNETVKQLISSGYTPYDSVIRFICAWKGKEDTEESAVILADIYFSRNEDRSVNEYMT